MENRNEIEMLNDFIGQKDKYRKIIHAAITKWVRDFQDGRVQISTVDDLRTLMQIEIELQKSMRFDTALKKHEEE